MSAVWFRPVTVPVVCGSLALLVVSFPERHQPPDPTSAQEAGAPRDPVTQFDGELVLPTADGRGRQVRVVVRNWIIDARRTIRHFPEEGFLVVQLRGGEVTTVINGVRAERREDEFWTVPLTTSMSLQTDREAAVIQTVSVRNVDRP